MNPKQTRIETKYNIFIGEVQLIEIDQTRLLDPNRPYKLVYDTWKRNLMWFPNYKEEDT